MALDASSPRSRRALLTAAVSATAVTVADAVARPHSIAALNGDNLVLGQSNYATSPTVLTNDSANGEGDFFKALEVAVTGFIAVALYGSSPHGTGVRGDSDHGTGVVGTSSDRTGVSGASVSGWGVTGDSNSGTAVYARSVNGKALDVEGKSHFSRSGKATITAGHLSITVTVPGGLSGTPLCFANLRSYRPGIAVAAVRPNYPSAGKMRIYLTKSVSRSTSVSWIVMG
jgi:hypothetical protein